MEHAPDWPENLQKIPTAITAYYALEKPAAPSGEAPVILVAMHGWGQNASRFARYFARLTERNVVIVAPQGFHQFYLDPGAKKVGFNWLTVFDRAAAIADCNRFVDQILDGLEENFPSRQIFLLGFSQGSAMAWRYAISAKRSIAGLISVGADLPPDVASHLSERQAFPVLLLRGDADELVPQAVTDEVRAKLSEAHWPFEQAQYRGEHRINDDAVAKIGNWIASVEA